MDKSEILEFFKRNPVVYLATVEGKHPRVRGMMLYKITPEGIIFHTGRAKDLHKQLELNPQVELCAFSQKENTQVRLSGTAEQLKDDGLKKEMVENRPFMKPWVAKYGLDLLTVWRIKPQRACAWTMETNFNPKEYIEF